MERRRRPRAWPPPAGRPRAWWSPPPCVRVVPRPRPLPRATPSRLRAVPRAPRAGRAWPPPPPRHAEAASTPILLCGEVEGREVRPPPRHAEAAAAADCAWPSRLCAERGEVEGTEVRPPPLHTRPALLRPKPCHALVAAASAVDLERLARGERLGDAFHSVPLGPADLAGRWTAQFRILGEYAVLEN